MDKVLENIKQRRSIRSFKSEPVKEEYINKIIEAGLSAPSGLNRQAGIIIAVTNKELRDKISKLNAQIGGMGENKDPFYNAPVILIVLAKKSAPTYIYDGSVMIENMLLEATSLGLGSIWIHRAKEEFETPFGKELLKSLNTTDEYEGIGHCAIGYVNGEIPQVHPINPNRVFFIK